MIPDGQDAATALDSTFHIGVVAVETGEWEAEASVPERHTTGLFYLSSWNGGSGQRVPACLGQWPGTLQLLCCSQL